MVVMVNEKTGDKFARMAGKKGVVEWLVEEMNNELNAWGLHGGPSGHGSL